MDRREALKRVALLTGVAIASPLATAILQGCETPAAGVGEGLKYLSQKEFDLLSEIAERIIPKTDTPGAKDANVAGFIDTMLAEFYKEDDAKKYKEQLNAFDADCKKATGKSFVELNDKERDAHLKTVEDAAHKAVEANKGEGGGDIFWFNVKQGTISAFLVSEAGCTKFRKYIDVPGKYDGCMPLAEATGGLIWAE
jgi:hypothetical protein